MAVARSTDGRDTGSGRVLAHISDDRVILAGLAVAPTRRRAGIAADLLVLVEESARRRGAAGITLGGVDEAVGFYLRRGYKPLLLVQFVEHLGVEELIYRARAGRLAGLGCVRREFEGVPQLFVEVDGIDLALRETVGGRAPGRLGPFRADAGFQVRRRRLAAARNERVDPRDPSKKASVLVRGLAGRC